MLTALMVVSCWPGDNPVTKSTSLEVDTSDLVLSLGGTATRAATTQSPDYHFTYVSANPSVATVDQDGKVTAMCVGETMITVYMDEPIGSGYTSATQSYKVIVKNISATDLKNVDKTTPLTLVAAENGWITVYFYGGVTLTNDIHYTINGGEELTIDKNTAGKYDISVNMGDVVQLYSINKSLGGGGGGAESRRATRAVDTSAKYVNIKPSMKTEIYGNVMSLLKGKDNLSSAEAIESDRAFYGLFAGAEKLVNSEDRNLVLPATTLKEGCYQEMFSGCKGIEKAPELPAPTLVKDCYNGMFAKCSKLSAVKCLAMDASAEGCVKDWLTDAGKEAETTPVVETVKGSNLLTIPDAIPDYVKVVVAVSKITLEPASTQTLIVGETLSLKAAIEPENAADKSVEWSSSNMSVASINPNGLSESLEATVTAVSAGTATITVCTPDGSVSATCEVKVEAAQVPDDTPKIYKVWVYGEDQQREPPFIPAARDAASMRFSSTEGHHFRTLTDDEYFGLKTLIFDVTDATDDCIMTVMDGWWANTYEDYVPVLNGQMKIQITEKIANDCAKGGEGHDLDLMLYSGSCTINSVYYMEGESKEEVGEKVLITDISLPESFTMESGTTSNTLAAQIRITPDNATDKSVTWTFDNPDIVRVNKYGVAFAQKDATGVAHATATANDGSGKSATCTITVKGVEKPVTGEGERDGYTPGTW